MKLIEITSLGCMSCIVMSDRIEVFAKKHNLALEVINSDLEETSHYGDVDLYPIVILLNQDKVEIKRIEGEYSLKDLEKKLLGITHA